MSRNYTPAYNPGGDLFSEDESFSQSYEAYEKRRADILKEREDDKQSRARSRGGGVRSRVSDEEKDRILEKLRKYGVKHSAASEQSKSGMVNSEGVDLSRVKGARFIDVDLDSSRGAAQNTDETNDEIEGAVAANGENTLSAEEAVEGYVDQGSGTAKEGDTGCGCMDKCDCACCNGEDTRGEEGDVVEVAEGTDGTRGTEKGSVADEPVIGDTSSSVGLHCNCGKDCKCDHGKHSLPHQVDEKTEEELLPEHIPLFGDSEDVEAASEHDSVLLSGEGGQQSSGCDCVKGCNCASGKPDIGDARCDCGEKCGCVDCHCVGHGEKEDVVRSSHAAAGTELSGDGLLGCDCGKVCKCDKCDCADCNCVSHGKQPEDGVSAGSLELVGRDEHGQVMPSTDVENDGQCGCCDRCDLPGCKQGAVAAGEASEKKLGGSASSEVKSDVEKDNDSTESMHGVTLEEKLGYDQALAEGESSYLGGDIFRLGATDASDREFGEDADWAEEDYVPPAAGGGIDSDEERDNSLVGDSYNPGEELDDALPGDGSECSHGVVDTDSGQQSAGIGTIYDSFGGDTHSRGAVEDDIDWGENDTLGEDEGFEDDSVDFGESREDKAAVDPDDADYDLDEKALPEDDEEEEDDSWYDIFSGNDGLVGFSDLLEGSGSVFPDGSEGADDGGEGGDNTSLATGKPTKGDNVVGKEKKGGYKGLVDEEEGNEGYYELPMTFNGSSTFFDFDR